MLQDKAKGLIKSLALPIPSTYKPTTRLLPTTKEITPWIDRILSYCEDDALYKEHQLLAKPIVQRHSSLDWTNILLKSLY